MKYLPLFLIFILGGCASQKRVPISSVEVVIPQIEHLELPKPEISLLVPIKIIQTPQSLFYSALGEMQKMLQNKSLLDFKKAVYLTENAWHNDTLSYSWFCGKIKEAENECNDLSDKYLMSGKEHSYDSIKVCKNAGIYYFMIDTIWQRKGWVRFPVSYPMKYDFEDFMGEKDWTKMFVSKLLSTNSGNCHSLPYLYKIMADDIGADVWLSLAPHHIYLKSTNLRSGWYNIELTNGYYPQDAWIRACGYITKDAIVNRLYMDTIGTRKAITLCIVDLAQGYEHKFGKSDNFVMECTETALKYFPNNVNALVLKAETLHKLLDETMKDYQISKIQDVSSEPIVNDIYNQMNATYTALFDLGYREMPEPMYKNWVAFMKEQQNKEQAYRKNKNSQN
jgi:hypothetical protein